MTMESRFYKVSDTIRNPGSCEASFWVWLLAMGVDHGEAHVAVPQKLLNDPYVVVGLQKVASKTVANDVAGPTLSDFDHAEPSYRNLGRIYS